jgi:hypothetical protein
MKEVAVHANGVGSKGAPVLGAVVLAWATVLPASRAEACRCVPRTLEEHVREAAAIFEGRVRSIEPADPTGPGGGPLRVVFDVVQTWRGANAERVEVITAGSSAACGYGFEVGHSYLVYADATENGGLSVGLCSRTRPADEADEDRERLGSGVVPVEVDEGEHPDRARNPVPPVPPRGGACAGCAAGGRGPDGPWRPFAVALVVLARRRRAYRPGAR